jgi:membrane protein DedA with SNARE-associated domain
LRAGRPAEGSEIGQAIEGAGHASMLEVQRYVAEYHGWFYLITLVWTFFEGESFVILAGAVAAKGLLDPFALMACAAIGSWLGDQCWFFLGRYFGHLLVRRFPDWQIAIDRVHRWIERWEVIFILSFRFIYGIRNFSSLALGISDIHPYRFMVLNFVSAVLWSVSFVGTGYLFGQAVENLRDVWGPWVGYAAVAAIAVAIIGVWIVRRLRARRSRAARDQAGEGQ